MHDAIAARFQFGQQNRERGRGLRMDVVQQQNALALGGEAVERAADDAGFVDPALPVLRHHIGAPDHQPF